MKKPSKRTIRESFAICNLPSTGGGDYEGKLAIYELHRDAGRWILGGLRVYGIETLEKAEEILEREGESLWLDTHGEESDEG